MLYALTLNQGHGFYSSTCSDVLKKLILNLAVDYAEIVCHNHDHFHCIISTPVYLEDDSRKGIDFHFEKIRNVSAYLKYMYSHDVTEYVKFGELPYSEDESIIDFVCSFGPVKAVQKFGWSALKQYRNIKDFYSDYKKG